MSDDTAGLPAREYVRVCRAEPDGSQRELVLSPAALHLHTFGVLNSIEAGTPGFVSDDYLDSVRADTTLPALELQLCGLWKRSGFGYCVADHETLAVAGRLSRHLDELAARCEAQGGHRPGALGGTCMRCGGDA